jgi:hypothetical protein
MFLKFAIAMLSSACIMEKRPLASGKKGNKFEDCVNVNFSCFAGKMKSTLVRIAAGYLWIQLIASIE